MPNKHHSIEFQDQACKLVSEQKYTQEKAAKELGITTVTLRAWLKRRGLLQPVQVIEPDYVSSSDPALLKVRIRELEKKLKRSETEKEILSRPEPVEGKKRRLTLPARVNEIRVDQSARRGV